VCSRFDIKFFGCSFLLSNQLMAVFGMAEHVSSDRLESIGGTIAVNPGQHLAEMDQFVLHNPLHRSQPIGAVVAADSNGIARLSERLK